MNFFKLYMGDYQRDTAHLSIAEHGAYLLMLQHHYATEKPLPTGAGLYRLLRAEGAADKRAIDAVVARYWIATDDGLVNERALLEFERAAHTSRANRDAALQREAKKRARTDHESWSERGKNTPRIGPRKQHLQTPDSSEDLRSSGEDAPPGPAAPENADPRKQLFALGKTILGASSGGLISSAISRTSEAEVGKVLGQMAVRTTADPKAYFVAATTPRERGAVC